ncbi:MAG TPA: acetyl-CoA carboxylase biotin carboxyl carrier protein [Verrucomicrobiae bacterium]|nr:acetyl-CoA carboxylase biotin carboxyl carrier protein [Verrucomicrobiae bacterium]
MELKDIEAIIELMAKNGLAEFDLEREGSRIRIRREVDRPPAVPMVAVAAPQATAPSHAPPPPPEAPTDSRDILSPMVGTFYRAPSPDAPNYIEIGQQVTEDTVVCIIEAMKVMNEIKAETRGFITEALAENGRPVDFGKPLFRIRPN